MLDNNYTVWLCTMIAYSLNTIMIYLLVLGKQSTDKILPYCLGIASQTIWISLSISTNKWLMVMFCLINIVGWFKGLLKCMDLKQQP